jgi:L-lysine exporter family protein LysE/ArgO
MHAALAGFSLGLSLILAIGAQNAFVLRQGLRREHVVWICLLCAISDAILIALGVSGFSVLLKSAPWLAPLMRYGGVAFLLWYGARSLWTAWRSSASLMPGEAPPRALMPTLLTCAALTWLNPHVYLDTVVLLGSIATQFPGAHLAFALGAMCASLVFFFALGYGAALLRPLFARPVAWKVLEILVGLTMWAIALKLLRG